MLVLLVISLILNAVWLGVIWFLWDEVRHRDRHLRWVDERDQGVVHLFQKVAEAKVVPMTNPLDGMKQHGMITRNAINATYMVEMDERLTHAQGFLRRALSSAKDLEAWEARNPAPPLSRWKKRKAAVGSPIPTPWTENDPRPPVEVTGLGSKDRSTGVMAPKASLPSATERLGEGAFGPEVD